MSLERFYTKEAAEKGVSMPVIGCDFSFVVTSVGSKVFNNLRAKFQSGEIDGDEFLAGAVVGWSLKDEFNGADVLGLVKNNEHVKLQLEAFINDPENFYPAKK